MNAEQTTGRVWNRRRTEKQRRLAEANIPGKVIPTDQLVSVLENLIAPGDRVVLEGNNQKQADFLSRMLAEVNPQKIHDLHMIMPSAFRSCWKMACSKSAPSTPISNSTPACTSICRLTSR